MSLNWQTLSSSNLDAVAHDGENLHVKFKDGGYYIYAGCDAGHADAMARAPSPGRYFHQNIKGQYPYEQA